MAGGSLALLPVLHAMMNGTYNPAPLEGVTDMYRLGSFSDACVITPVFF